MSCNPVDSKHWLGIFCFYLISVNCAPGLIIEMEIVFRFLIKHQTFLNLKCELKETEMLYTICKFQFLNLLSYIMPIKFSDPKDIYCANLSNIQIWNKIYISDFSGAFKISENFACSKTDIKMMHISSCRCCCC